MFEDLILAIYLLMTKIFCECNCIFYGGRGQYRSLWPAFYVVRGYDHEPEYTADELESRSKAAVSVYAPAECSSVVANWCQCGCCRAMPTLAECVCCRSSELTLLGTSAV